MSHMQNTQNLHQMYFWDNPSCVHVFTPSSHPSPLFIKSNRWNVIAMGATLTPALSLCVSEASGSAQRAASGLSTQRPR